MTKRLGRPPLDPRGGPSRHTGCRLPEPMWDRLQARVAAANEKMLAHGLPPTVTPASLIRMWIEKELSRKP